jgi:hypothetical protein
VADSAIETPVTVAAGVREGAEKDETVLQLAKPAIFKERFRTIERVFAWEDKFRRVLIRFERISSVHYALKTLAYTMINLRHFCG